MDLETLREIASLAVFLAYGTGSILTLAILEATVKAMWPEMQATVWVEVRWALCVALESFCLVVVGMAVTYLHTYQADRETARPEADGRHRAGFGRLSQPAGRHRTVAA